MDETSDLPTTRDRDIEILKFRLTQKENEIDEISCVRDKDIQNLKIVLSETEHKFEEILIGPVGWLWRQNQWTPANSWWGGETVNRSMRTWRSGISTKAVEGWAISYKKNAAQAMSVLPKQPRDSLTSSLTDENQSWMEQHLERREQKDNNASDT